MSSKWVWDAKNVRKVNQFVIRQAQTEADLIKFLLKNILLINFHHSISKFRVPRSQVKKSVLTKWLFWKNVYYVIGCALGFMASILLLLTNYTENCITIDNRPRYIRGNPFLNESWKLIEEN